MKRGFKVGQVSDLPLLGMSDEVHQGIHRPRPVILRRSRRIQCTFRYIAQAGFFAGAQNGYRWDQ